MWTRIGSTICSQMRLMMDTRLVKIKYPASLIAATKSAVTMDVEAHVEPARAMRPVMEALAFVSLIAVVTPVEMTDVVPFVELWTLVEFAMEATLALGVTGFPIAVLFWINAGSAGGMTAVVRAARILSLVILTPMQSSVMTGSASTQLALWWIVTTIAWLLSMTAESVVEVMLA